MPNVRGGKSFQQLIQSLADDAPDKCCLHLLKRRKMKLAGVICIRSQNKVCVLTKLPSSERSLTGALAAQ